MSRIVKVKNNTVADATWVGQTIDAGLYHDIPLTELNGWVASNEVFASIGSGDLIVNKGADVTDDITDATAAWNWMLGDTLPISNLGKQLAVHQSTKPEVPGKEFYLQWTGAGDDVDNGLIGEGEILAFEMTDQDASITKDIKFAPQFGDVYIHEGYAKWNHDSQMSNGTGDHMSAMIMANGTPMQQTIDLDYIVEDDWVKYSPQGPGTGTHGLAATPVLVPRTFMKDGDWDYDGTNLTPNFAGDGGYKISTIMRTVHRYMNKIPMCFSSGSYNRLTSDETAFLPPGYFIRVTAFNSSGTNWNCAFMFEVYRERTAVP